MRVWRAIVNLRQHASGAWHSDQEIPGGVPPAGPRFPVPGPRFPVPAESGSGIPSPFPGQIGNRGNGNWGLPGLVVILHRPVLGSLRRKPEAGGLGGQNLHLRDLMQHPAQDHSCCAHTRRVPPISRFAANRETGDFPIPDSESEIGDSLPVSRPNRKSGERKLRISAGSDGTSRSASGRGIATGRSGSGPKGH